MSNVAEASISPFEAAPGAVLDGKYRLVDRLGRGGFGDVWRAEEILPDGAPLREVALKLLGEGRGADGWAEEAKLLASFRHPSLVTIYAAGILNRGGRFVAMEVLEGRTLAEVLRERGKVPWRRVLAWAHSVASALDTIHAHGVVHLDLKPANLFLTNDGVIKVLDFGIAERRGVARVSVRAEIPPRALDATAPVELATVREGKPGARVSIALASTSEAFAATHVAASGGGSVSARVVVGTPGFIAPEVLAAREPTHAADAYALGVCIAELATGKLPQDAPEEPAAWNDPSAVSAWLEAVHGAAKRGALRPLDGALPAGVCELVVRLLEVDPVARGVASGCLARAIEEAMRLPYGIPATPYFGLAALPSTAEGLLFGRDDDLARLGRELAFEGCLVVQGARGAGKTSFVRAGLVPHLAWRAVDGMDDLRILEIARGDDPDAALAAALTRLAPELGGEEGVDADALAAHAAAGGLGIVLFVDALEQIGAAPAEKRTRLEALVMQLAERRRPGVRFIATLAEEHAADVLATPLGEGLRGSARFVGAPPATAARDIVVGPAELAGVEVTRPELVVAEVERELRAGHSRLPLIAVALASWWTTRADVEARASDPMVSSRRRAARLSGARFRDAGGVAGALARHADATLAAMPIERRVVAERMLLRLGATDGTPRVWPESELIEAAGGEGALATLIELEEARLVERRAGSVAFAHEAFAKGSTALANLRLARMETLSLAERVRDAALAHQREGEHKDFLLHGALLESVRAHADIGGLGLTEHERSFVRSSVAAAKRRRGARFGAVLLALAAIVTGLAVARALDMARKAEEAAKNAAVELEYTSELAAKSRRAADPYARAAFAAEAMARGSFDAALPVELAAAAANAARADVLTLEKVTSPEFYWDDRFLIALGAGGELVIVDFRPKEPDVIEDVDINADPELTAARHAKRPAVKTFRPHTGPLAEVTPFAFDKSFVTRAVSGEVKVFRLNDLGEIALAGVAPMRCAGPVHVAAAAAIVACATEAGIAHWDIARGDQGLRTTDLEAQVADVSPDGSLVAARVTRKVVLWSPDGEKKAPALFVAPYGVAFARFSPDGRSLAIASGEGDEHVASKGAVDVLRVASFTKPAFTERFDFSLRVGGGTPVAQAWASARPTLARGGSTCQKALAPATNRRRVATLASPRTCGAAPNPSPAPKRPKSSKAERAESTSKPGAFASPAAAS